MSKHRRKGEERLHDLMYEASRSFSDVSVSLEEANRCPSERDTYLLQSRALANEAMRDLRKVEEYFLHLRIDEGREGGGD